VRQLLGALLGLLVRVWVATLRVQLVGWGSGSGPAVLAFLHGNQMALLPVRSRAALTVLVSLSRDGELQTGVLRSLGVGVLRGSSSRRASAGLRGLVRSARDGRCLGFAVDGPRGPAGIAKRGAAFAAGAAGVPLRPVAAASTRTLRLERTWDRFEVPLPFTRVVVVVGPEISASAVLASPELLSQGISEARVAASGLVDPASRGRVRAREAA